MNYSVLTGKMQMEIHERVYLLSYDWLEQLMMFTSFKSRFFFVLG